MQWDVLRHLHDQPDATPHTLAEPTFQTDQSMGTLAKRMVDRGLLKRADGPSRATRHELTHEGERAYESGAQIVQTVWNKSLGALGDAERVALHEPLLKAADAGNRTETLPR